MEKLFTDYMNRTVSVRDTFVRRPLKENFYHGILLGILGFKAGWTLTSNREAGDGFSDITVIADEEETGIVIEVKYAQDAECEEACRRAIGQINEKNYARGLILEGMRTVLKYGIACNRKKCRVLLEKEQIM